VAERYMRIERVGHAIRDLASTDAATKPWETAGLDLNNSEAGGDVLVYSQYGCWRFPIRDRDIVVQELHNIADLIKDGVPD
jgi:hypothetical protein